MLALTLSAIILGFGTLCVGFAIAHVLDYRASR